VGQDVYIEGDGKRVEPLASLTIKIPEIGLILHECRLDGIYPDIILMGIALSQFPGSKIKDTSASADGYLGIWLI
jgi:hypothetical protein